MMHFCDKLFFEAGWRTSRRAKKERFLKRLFYLFDFTAKKKRHEKGEAKKKTKNDAKMRLSGYNAFVKKGFNS